MINQEFIRAIIEDVGIIKLATAILSVPAVHVIAFCLNLESNILAIVDATFLAHIVFHFSLIFVLSVFCYRIAYGITAGIATDLSGVFSAFRSVWVFFVYSIRSRLGRRMNKRNTSVVKVLRKWFQATLNKKTNNISYVIGIFISTFVVLEIFSRYYIGRTIYFAFVGTLLGSLLYVSILTNRMTLKILLDKRYENNSELKPPMMVRELLKEQSVRKYIVLTVYLAVSIFSALTGELRYRYLLNQKALLVETEIYKNNLKYIGETRNGVVLFNGTTKAQYFISYDGSLMMFSH